MDRSRSENNHNRGSNEFWPHDPPWSEVAINVALGRPFPQVRHGKCICDLKFVSVAIIFIICRELFKSI